MKSVQERLIIYADKSILEKDNVAPQIFVEGKPSANAQTRTDFIRKSLDAGFLRELIVAEKQKTSANRRLSADHGKIIESLVNSVTSEVGRALIGLTVLQLCIKSICPEQNIRLHKGGRGDFSWEEGISMRTLDKSYITPALREFDLLSLNADGFMMTRSLAENYPYGTLYKAAMRGAKNAWIAVVEALEEGSLPPLEALTHLISLLINKSKKFEELTNDCIAHANSFLTQQTENIDTFCVLTQFINQSEYSARAFEIVIHSAYQALQEMNLLEPNRLKPLSQMRSANKKHGNIGDIEILSPDKGIQIIEAWDAKFGKDNLREELEELSEKLSVHPDCKKAGFITDKEVTPRDEIIKRIEDISEYHKCEIEIISFELWHKNLINIFVAEDHIETFSKKWLIAVAESFGQKRRDLAPIDEPCEAWIKSLSTVLQNHCC